MISIIWGFGVINKNMLHKPFPTLIGKQRKAEEQKIEQEKKENIGKFMTQDHRKQVSYETKRTHFSLGHGNAQ